jgi:hypothetical protein
MTDTPVPARVSLTQRWPTGLALVSAVAAIVLLDHTVEQFGPLVVTMAGIYVMTYALGPPLTVWPSFVALSIVFGVLRALDDLDALPVDPAVVMTAVVVLLWLWTVLRRRFTDGSTFRLQTAGLVGFGAVTLVCAAIAPQWGLALAGVGWLAHGAWDAYHFATNKVVHRTYAEFCGVIDVVVGPALIVAALV